MRQESLIQKSSFQFSLDSIKLYKELVTQNEYVLSKQLLRSDTSIGANVEEAGTAQSKIDLIAKMSISSKEARETRYWLRLLNESDLVDIDVSDLHDESDQIINILTKIVKTSQGNS